MKVKNLDISFLWWSGGSKYLGEVAKKLRKQQEIVKTSKNNLEAAKDLWECQKNLGSSKIFV